MAHRPATACSLTPFSRACRNIDKAGGLDGYILNTSDKDMDSVLGIELKVEMLEKLLAAENRRTRGARGAAMSPVAAALLAEPAPAS